MDEAKYHQQWFYFLMQGQGINRPNTLPKLFVDLMAIARMTLNPAAIAKTGSFFRIFH